MATEKQIAANRESARCLMRLRTVDGKSKSSRNAFRHTPKITAPWRGPGSDNIYNLKDIIELN